MTLKKGDLIRFKRSGRVATVMRDEYIARFLDSQDDDMMAHGMGHLAGTYAPAVDVCYMDTMETRRKIKVTTRIELLSLNES